MSKPPVEDALRSIAPQLKQMASNYARTGHLDADDLMQEARIRIWHTYATYDAKHPFRSWALTVAYNCMTDVYRKSLRHACLRLDAPACISGDDGQPMRYGDTLADTQEDFAARLERAAWVAQLLTYTTPERAALLLRSNAGYTEAEMAAEFGLTEGTVKSRMHRAKADIRHKHAIEAQTDALRGDLRQG